MYTTPAGQDLRRHPIRGFFWGLLMGLGITVALIITNTIALGTITPILVVVFTVLFGIVWGLFAPPRKAKGDAPVVLEPVDPAEPVEATPIEADQPVAQPAETEAAVAAEPMTPEETAASRETIVGPGGPTDHGGTVVEPPGEPDTPTD